MTKTKAHDEYDSDLVDHVTVAETHELDVDEVEAWADRNGLDRIDGAYLFDEDAIDALEQDLDNEDDEDGSGSDPTESEEDDDEVIDDELE